MDKRLVLPGSILWIAGLILSIAGMNIQSDTGKLLAVIGNIILFIGLGIVGAAWLIRQKKQEEKKQGDS